MNLIEIHNIKEYNDAIEHIKLSYGRYFDKDATCISWKLEELSEFKDPEIRNIFKSNVYICNEAMELLGKTIIFSGHEIGILRGVEITEEDFYWIVEDIKTSKRVSMSCVGRIDRLDLDLLKKAISYGKIEAVNNTTPTIAFINGSIWREQNPNIEMIQKILDLSLEYEDNDNETKSEFVFRKFKEK